uniref:Uncharacterized protein n=1 Tax=Ditylenchus dipsaci TaxID=166011 RepID=A0A915E6J5_9BILA
MEEFFDSAYTVLETKECSIDVNNWSATSRQPKPKTEGPVHWSVGSMNSRGIEPRNLVMQEIFDNENSTVSNKKKKACSNMAPSKKELRRWFAKKRIKQVLKEFCSNEVHLFTGVTHNKSLNVQMKKSFKDAENECQRITQDDILASYDTNVNSLASNFISSRPPADIAPKTQKRKQLARHISQLARHISQLARHISQLARHISQLADTSHNWPDTSHNWPDTSHIWPDTSHNWQNASHNWQNASHNWSDKWVDTSKNGVEISNVWLETTVQPQVRINFFNGVVNNNNGQLSEPRDQSIQKIVDEDSSTVPKRRNAAAM